jgi:hypothetical protein
MRLPTPEWRRLTILATPHSMRKLLASGRLEKKTVAADIVAL